MTRFVRWAMAVCLLGIAGEARAQAVYVPNQWEDRDQSRLMLSAVIGLTL
jgi:hypothetical protein